MSRVASLVLASFVVLVLVSGVSAPTARADEAVVDLQTWSQVQLTAPLDAVLKGLSFTLESTVRRGSPGSINKATGSIDDRAVTYLFVRPSIGLKVLPHLQLALGYAFSPVFYDDPANADVVEQRVWEQASTSHRFGRLGVATRSRLEERMRSRGQGQGDTELRLRERLRVAVALGSARRMSWVASDELLFFFNDSSFESRPGFSENRAFTGLSYRADEHLAVELGYLHQFVGGRVGTHRSNHVLSTSISFTLG